MVGIATLTIVVSSRITKKPRQRTSSASQGFRFDSTRPPPKCGLRAGPGEVPCVIGATLAESLASCKSVAYPVAMRKRSLGSQPCPVARTLDVIGEWWTLVIVRDAFRGSRRFEDFRSIGIADNILSARLKKLVEEGVFERRRYREHPERFEYLLTEKGRDLLMVVAAL